MQIDLEMSRTDDCFGFRAGRKEIAIFPRGGDAAGSPGARIWRCGRWRVEAFDHETVAAAYRAQREGMPAGDIA